MTAAAPLARTPRASRPDEKQAKRLLALIEPTFLAAAGWDADTQVLTPPADHPQFGYQVCMVAGCTTEARRRGGLCPSCDQHWLASGLDLDAFAAAGPKKMRVLGEFFCAVSGCGRPRKSTLARVCYTHDAQRERLGLELDAFLAHPDVWPLPTLGPCRVPACQRAADNHLGICRAHRSRWRRYRSQHPDVEPDLAAWCRSEVPVTEGQSVVLRGLSPLLQAELLYGLQERVRRNAQARLQVIRGVGHLLRTATVASFLDLDAEAISANTYRQLVLDVQTAVRRAFSSPELERGKDVWDMGVFGLGKYQRIDFTIVSQPWLRAGTKHWVFEEIPTRYGTGVATIMRDHVVAVGELSASLRTHRTDHGDISAALGRADIVTFLNRLAHLVATGRMSAKRRRVVCREVAKVLREGRDMGLTRPGQPMAGLPDDFALRKDDIPPEPDDEEPGRALPREVIAQLIDGLPRLEAISNREMRVAVELLIDTGRRPDEICKLPWDCLEQGADGKHDLIYTNFKANRVGRRLAITDATAAFILDQKQTVRDRFPDTPLGELALLPRAKRNPAGTVATNESTLGSAHRRWVNELPVLRLKDGTEFDKAAVVPYAYRHSYAQRHADNGTPIDVLRDLMDHRSTETTQGYYRVTERRTRAAVDQLAAFQFNGHGDRVWRQAERLLDSEHQRLRIGQVAVPYGTCSEPSNVKAGGGACPFRFRCHGCAHFRTDPSYLPELRAYLDTLLRDRERVRATTELDDWARAEAMPSDAEIGRVRALIRKIEQAVDDLDDAEQRLVDEATRALRATRRTVHLGMPTVRPPDLDPDLRLEAIR
jgi:integrase